MPAERGVLGLDSDGGWLSGSNIIGRADFVLDKSFRSWQID
jgi:hypothetical protein